MALITCKVLSSGPRETISPPMAGPWPTLEASVPKEEESGTSDGGFKGCCSRSSVPPRLCTYYAPCPELPSIPLLVT